MISKILIRRCNYGIHEHVVRSFHNRIHWCFRLIKLWRCSHPKSCWERVVAKQRILKSQVTNNTVIIFISFWKAQILKWIIYFYYLICKFRNICSEYSWSVYWKFISPKPSFCIWFGFYGFFEVSRSFLSKTL